MELLCITDVLNEGKFFTRLVLIKLLVFTNAVTTLYYGKLKNNITFSGKKL